MNPWRWVDPRVGSVRLDGVRAWFERRGYVEKPGPNPNLIRFEETGGRNGEPAPYYVLPSSERLSDYVSSITFFLTTFSEVENTHPVRILEEVLQLQASEVVAGH